MILLYIIITIIYAGLILWLADGIKNLKNYELEESVFPEISVIVSARNEEDNLPNLISALENQTYPKDLVKIIIVNDRSTDRTEEILKKYQLQNALFHFITVNETPEEWAPKKWALNCAIEYAKTDIILQTDADCIPHENWIKMMVKPFSNPEIGFVSAPAPLTNNITIIDSLFELDSLAQDAFSAGGFYHGLTFSCTGRNMGFLKQAFNDINGYKGISHFISGDDDLLLHKISGHPSYKTEFVISEQSTVDSPPPPSIEKFIRQRLRFASKGFSYFNIKTSKSLKIILPFLYITNLVSLISIFNFVEFSTFYWIIPWIIKSIADIVITYIFYLRIKREWNLAIALLLSLIHPLYIVIFGIWGPFSTIEWKKDE